MTVELAAQIAGQIKPENPTLANSFVKVDAQIGKNCQRTISYLQEYLAQSFSCKKLSNEKPKVNTVRNTRRTTLC